MTHFTGWNPPQTYDTVAAGDTWARGTTGITFTWDGVINAWLPTTPIGAETGLVIAGGGLDQHLAKAGTQAYNLKWVDSSGGILFQHQQTTASDTWQVQHSLRQQYVSVTVVPAIEGTWYGVPGTTIIPEIDFRTVQICVLHFAYPLLGTALIRR